METIVAYLPNHILEFSFLGAASVLLFLFVFQIKKTHWILYLLLAWFPFESLILRYTPIDYFSYVKYIPELILYAFGAGSFLSYIRRTGHVIPKNPLNRWFLCYAIVALVSLLLNHYSPFTWLLGLRQVVRFVVLFFILLFLEYDEPILKRIIAVALSMIGLQAVLGIIQYLAGGHLDAYLFSSDVVQVGNTALIGSDDQMTQAGGHIFATMGRYDRLGSFLAIGIIGLFSCLYTLRDKQKRTWVIAGLVVCSFVLLLTASRASWLGAIAGVIAIGIGLFHDSRVKIGFGIGVALVAVYLGVFALSHQNLGEITERQDQTVAERIFESVSIRAWRESYEGYGRIFFIINTPRMVVLKHPLFGVGPGNYGGGVAAALVNTTAYDRLGLPFGIQNTFGQIDNSWWSIWGEVGTLGLIAFIGMFVAMAKTGKQVAEHYHDVFPKTIGIALFGIVIGMSVIGFFGPYFEFRTLMCYVWMVGGVVAVFYQRSMNS